MPTASYCAFTTAEVSAMIKAGHFEKGPPLEGVRGWIRLFPRTELAKSRRRILKHTHDKNDKCGRDLLQEMKHKHLADLLLSVHQGSWSVQLDNVSWYDQFYYAEAIRPFHCLLSPEGEILQMVHLGMGDRFGCEVGQCALDVLHASAKETLPLTQTDVPAAVSPISTTQDGALNTPSIVDTMIDNSRFLGHDRTRVIDDALRFALRCKESHVSVNELPSLFAQSPTDIREALSKLATQQDEFLGVRYDYAAGTVCVGSKTIGKLALLHNALLKRYHPTTDDELGSTFSNRSVIALFSTLFFCSRILGVSVAGYFHSIQWLRRLCADLTSNKVWRRDSDIPPSVLNGLESWLRTVLSNRPRSPSLFAAASADLLIVDSSAWGFGAIRVTSNGEVEVLSERWGPEDRVRSGQSTWAEPTGIVRALDHFYTVGRADGLNGVLVLSDNMSASCSLERGFSRSYDVNLICAALNERFPQLGLRFGHIAGILNLADGFSRGKAATVDDIDTTAVRALAASAAGTRWAKQQQQHHQLSCNNNGAFGTVGSRGVGSLRSAGGFAPRAFQERSHFRA